MTRERNVAAALSRIEGYLDVLFLSNPLPQGLSKEQIDTALTFIYRQCKNVTFNTEQLLKDYPQ